MINLAVEIGASLTTLVGMWIGSSAYSGAVVYLLSNLLWWVLMWRRRMFGLLPLNLGGLIVGLWNVWWAGL